ncbi:MAG: DNA polymerase III subunit gamma/tau [SAR324 cluster bacterium]|nr:DNA polymerase III subunit gamma/tau [SAR324 cluster bacterium]
MSYVVLARRLRPTQFDDLVGQETIAQILKNAILTDRVSHAFLFTGSRGVGKTSAARILTKAVNCLDPRGADPCEACQNCIDITNNASPDVFEIDAASNRGIDNIRELRENIKYVPANCRYKVYVIDEAHMLTLESFNALLKTLEEPPAHVKFILATTDPHKIPQTIISRCQRYDFVRIPLVKIVDYLEKVTRNENIQLSRKALEMVARHAIGGMRDALTTIDQIVSFTGKSASDEEIRQILGIVDSQIRFGLLNALVEKNSTEAMNQFFEMQQHGHDYQDILSELLQTVKNLSLVHTLIQSTGAIPPTLFQEIGQEDIEQYRQLISQISIDELQQMFHILLELEERIKRSNHAQICFEMALLQLTSVQPLVGITELLEQIQTIKEDDGTSGTALKIKKSSPGFQNSGESNSEPFTSNRQSPHSPTREQEKSLPHNEKRKESNSKEPGSNQEQGPSYKASDANSLIEPDASLTIVRNQKPAGEEQSPASGINSPIPSSPSFQEWETFVEHVQQISPRIGSVLKNAVLLERNEDRVQIAFKESQFAKMLSGEQANSLNEIARNFYGKSVRIVIQEDAPASEMVTMTENQQRLLNDERERRRQIAEQDEQTQKILKTFPGSKIIDIQIQEPKI